MVLNCDSYHVNVFLNAANPTNAHVNINRTLYNDESNLGRWGSITTRAFFDVKRLFMILKNLDNSKVILKRNVREQKLQNYITI